ncbi:MAG: hypothetical protein AAFY28_13915, partial [Actinomycetota bacterium]
QHDDRIRGVLADALRATNAAGDTHCDPQLGARLLFAAVNGIQVEARKGVSYDDARATLLLTLDALR